MATVTAATWPAEADRDNEDWLAATSDLIVVLDGATIRTDTGCVHGLPWFVRQLGAAIIAAAQSRDASLPDVLAAAIKQVARMHADSCDLSHPGTPSAAVGIVRRTGDRLDWAALGDITIMVEDIDRQVTVTVDERVSQTAPEQRRECDQHLLGTPEKMAAIQAMKPHELAARNTPTGYWIASVDPAAAQHAHTGSATAANVNRVGVCSDGAMRALGMTNLVSHEGVMDVLRHGGPEALLNEVRVGESADRFGARHPRNKGTDDATAVLLDLSREKPAPKVSETDRDRAIADLTMVMNSPNLIGSYGGTYEQVRAALH